MTTTYKTSQNRTTSLPTLPHPINWNSQLVRRLTPKQQRANLITVASWLLNQKPTTSLKRAANWRPTSDLVWVALLMNDSKLVNCPPIRAGELLLGKRAAQHFCDNENEARAFLLNVVNHRSFKSRLLSSWQNLILSSLK